MTRLYRVMSYLYANIYEHSYSMRVTFLGLQSYSNRGICTVVIYRVNEVLFFLCSTTDVDLCP